MARALNNTHPFESMLCSTKTRGMIAVRIFIGQLSTHQVCNGEELHD